MSKYFICNQSKVNIKLRDLTETGTSEDGWDIYYIDNNSGEEWVLSYYNSEYHGGGVQILRRLPEISIDELINLAMTSTEKDEIVGASHELLAREKTKQDDFRNKLIKRLQQINTKGLDSFERERLKIIIYESNLHDATNRRPILEKHYSKIQKDGTYYREIAQKAKRIITALSVNNS